MEPDEESSPDLAQCQFRSRSHCNLLRGRSDFATLPSAGINTTTRATCNVGLEQFSLVAQTTPGGDDGINYRAHCISQPIQ
jgi:hypothetical protein